MLLLLLLVSVVTSGVVTTANTSTSAAFAASPELHAGDAVLGRALKHTPTLSTTDILRTF